MKKTPIIATVVIAGGILTYLFLTNPLKKTFHYPFSDKNNMIIKEVYSSGKVSCGGGYCLQIDTIISSDKMFRINGGPQLRLNNINVYVHSQENGKEFDVKIKSNSIIFGNDVFEQFLLDEITTQLFLNNDQDWLNQRVQFQNNTLK